MRLLLELDYSQPTDKIGSDCLQLSINEKDLTDSAFQREKLVLEQLWKDANISPITLSKVEYVIGEENPRTILNPSCRFSTEEKLAFRG